MEKFSFNKVIDYAKSHIRKLSTQGIYSAILLYNAWGHENTPRWAKNIILGSLAYFLSPIDSIPDLTPIIGMTDDISLMAFSLVTIACYINDDVRKKSYQQLQKIMKKDIDEDVIKEVNSWL